MVRKAVCLISGGLDSCVTAYVSKDIGFEIYALSFKYGQKHQREIRCAKKIAKSLDAKKHVIVDLPSDIFSGSSLTDEKINMQDVKFEDIGKKIPNTYVPARNTVFLSIALGFAESIDAEGIFIGATCQDYSGYPDCRPEYFNAFQNLIDIATKKTVEGEKIKIYTPLLNLSKDEIIKKGLSLNVAFEQTWSCYKGEDKACGVCDSCQLRLKGFKKAGFDDPIDYKVYPDWYKKK